MSTGRDVGVLDIGTTETRAVVGRVWGPGETEILGYGLGPSAGVTRGAVVDIEATARTIQRVVAAARESAGWFPSSVLVGVNGEYLQSARVSGTIPITGKQRGITHNDVSRVLRVAGEKNVSSDYQVLETVPCSFQVDQMLGVHDPVGKTGNLLVSEVFLVSVLGSVVSDLDRCIKAAGLDIVRLVPTGLATSLAVLSDEEKKAGVALVDIGGGATNIVVYYDGQVLHAETIPVGGGMITSSVARTLTCSMEAADHLKRTYGFAIAKQVAEVETVPVKRIPPRASKNIPRKLLAEIIEERTDRILAQVLKAFHRRELINRLFAGVILTGGASQLGGMKDKVESYLKIETHVGIPSRFQGYEQVFRSPRFASVIGLLDYASRPNGNRRTKNTKIGRFFERVGGILHYF